MANLKDRLERIFSACDAFVNGLLVLLIAVIVGVMLVSIFFRYVLNNSLSWSDEFIRYLFVWLTLVGSAVVFRDREHIRINYFIGLCPKPIRHLLDILILVLVTLFFLATLVLGVMWVNETSGTLTSSLGWPLNWFFYAALPASSLLGIVYAFRRFLGKRIGEQSALDEPKAAVPKGSSL